MPTAVRRMASPEARGQHVTVTIPAASGRLDGFVDAVTSALRLRNVLIPIDLRSPPHAAIRAVERLCRPPAATIVALHLLHIGEPGNMPAAALEGDVPFSLARSTRSGNVVNEIRAAAPERHADLIVIATAGHQSFLDASRGSTTERVLCHSHSPDLSVAGN